MSGHTPGPWTTRDSVVVPMGDSHADIAVVAGDPKTTDFQLVAEVFCRVGEQHCIDPGPNAALIAAAPELLESIEQLKSVWSWERCDEADCDVCPVRDRVDAAIRSARGLEDR